MKIIAHLLTVCCLTATTVQGYANTRKEVVHPAQDESPYLENIRGIRALLTHNLKSMINSNLPSYSLYSILINSYQITEVAQLFAQTRFLTEISKQPDEYGHLCFNGIHSCPSVTENQLKARGRFLSEKLRIVFTEGTDKISDYSRRAIDHLHAFHDIVRSWDDSANWTLENSMAYLDLLITEGFLNKKGPTYQEEYDSGAVVEYYYFTWAGVSMEVLAKAVAEDQFQIKPFINKAPKTEPAPEESIDDLLPDELE